MRRRPPLRSICAVLALLAAAAAHAAGPAPGGRIDRITAADGLPSELVRHALRAPDGTLWMALMEPAGPQRGLGIARYADGNVQVYTAKDGLRSPTVTGLHLRGDGVLYAGTDEGLHQFDGTRFIPFGCRWPVALIARSALTKSATSLFETVHIAEYPVGERRELAVSEAGLGPLTCLFTQPRSARRPLRLFGHVIGRDEDDVTVVTEDEILAYRGPAGFVPLPLEGSPLWRPAVADPDGPIPAVWIHDADLVASGDLLAAGHTKKLARYHKGRWDCLADGHFARIVADRSGGAWIADYSGGLFQYDGKTVSAFARIPGGTIGDLHVDAGGSLWVVVDYARAPSAVVRCDPGLSACLVTARYGLGEDSALSPGVLSMADDEAGGLLLSTNRGLWRLRR